jgi:hypothetical protein
MPDVIQIGIRKPRTNRLKTAPVTVGTQPNGDIGIAERYRLASNGQLNLLCAVHAQGKLDTAFWPRRPGDDRTRSHGPVPGKLIAVQEQRYGDLGSLRLLGDKRPRASYPRKGAGVRTMPSTRAAQIRTCPDGATQTDLIRRNAWKVFFSEALPWGRVSRLYSAVQSSDSSWVRTRPPDRGCWSAQHYRLLSTGIRVAYDFGRE